MAVSRAHIQLTIVAIAVLMRTLHQSRMHLPAFLGLSVVTSENGECVLFHTASYYYTPASYVSVFINASTRMYAAWCRFMNIPRVMSTFISRC